MFESRKYVIIITFVLVGVVFLAKLFSIQIVDKTYARAAEDNIILPITEYPYRGLIYDRNGELLVYNTPEFDLMITPKEVQIGDTAVFCEMLGITLEEFSEKIAKAKKYSYVKPSVFLEKLSNEDMGRISAKLVNHAGFNIRSRTARGYTYPSLSNALGYISEISKRELERDTINYYRQGDYIGKSGVESFYEEELRGKRGVRYKKVNVQGIDKGPFKNGEWDTLSVPGLNLQSTIDIDLQQYGEWLMEGKAGSIVAIEPSSGEILSIVSAPSYEPQLLSGRNYSSNFFTISTDTMKPLFNRPLMAMYRPGSIFKIVQAMVALQEGVITPSTRLKCNTNIIGCHNGASHPFGTSENLQGAIANSCNPYFHQTMRRIVNQNVVEDTYEDTRIGLEKWRDHIASFGFGAPVGVDLPNEKGGMIPNAAYYDRFINGAWKYSNIASISIGEGENLVVPIQMANFAAIVANRGHYYIPHVVKSIDNTGPLPKYSEMQYTSVDRQHFDIAVEAMADVVESGTGQYRAKLKDIQVCGKTGTVQNDPLPDHSVFIAFAPKDNPKIAVSVYVESAGQGARAAASIASLMIEKYLIGQTERPQIEAYVRKGEFLY